MGRHWRTCKTLEMIVLFPALASYACDESANAAHAGMTDGDCAMLIVSGDVTARADRREDMLRAALEHVHRSRLEPGCISHDVSIDAENPLRLMFFERWQDETALKTHFAVPASRAFWKLLQSLAAEPGAMHIHDAREIRF